MITGLFGAMGVYIIKAMNDYCILQKHKKRVYNWLKSNTEKGAVNREWRKSSTIASYTDLTADRVRYICSIHDKIRASRKEENDMWGLKELHGN